jgi:DNA gyrase inhibitor GyrI
MKLTKVPKIVKWPATHYVFIEKVGPFQNTAPKAWDSLHKLVPALKEKNKITTYFSLYKFKPKMTYRAGVGVSAKPKGLPKGMKYEKFKGGKYSRFVLTGPYSELPEACGIVFDIVKTKPIKMRPDFCIENYVNDPTKLKPGEEPITQILIPTV